MERFKKLQSGEIAWDSIREYVKEHNDFHRCLTEHGTPWTVIGG